VNLPEPGGHPADLTSKAEASGRAIPNSPFAKLKAMTTAMRGAVVDDSDTEGEDTSSLEAVESLFTPTREIQRPTRTRESQLADLKKLRASVPILRKTTRIIEAKENDHEQDGEAVGAGAQGTPHGGGEAQGGQHAGGGSEGSASRGAEDSQGAQGMGGGDHKLSDPENLTNAHCFVCEHDMCICPDRAGGGESKTTPADRPTVYPQPKKECECPVEGHMPGCQNDRLAESIQSGNQVSSPRIHLPVLQERKGRAFLQRGLTTQGGGEVSSTPGLMPSDLSDIERGGQNLRTPPAESASGDLDVSAGFTPYNERQELEAGMLLGGIPGIACNGCAAAESCPEFQENATCAYDDYFSGLSTRDVNNLLPRMEVIADLQFRRGMHAVFVERRKSGGQILPEVTRQLEIAAVAAERVARLKTPQHRDMRAPVVVVNNVQGGPSGGGLVSRLLAGVTGALPQHTGFIDLNPMHVQSVDTTGTILSDALPVSTSVKSADSEESQFTLEESSDKGFGE
jgi:hypothetical protein